MKKLKINVPALAISDVRNLFGLEPKIVKLSASEAVNFESKFASLQDMLSQYGNDRLLKTGQHYKGYAAVFYQSYRQHVVYMLGALQKVEAILNPAIPEYTIMTNTAKGVCPGTFLYMWTVRNCKFARLAEELKKNQLLPQNLDVAVLDVQLKDKIVAGLTQKLPVTVSEEEDLVLSSYLGNYYNLLFTE